MGPQLLQRALNYRPPVLKMVDNGVAMGFIRIPNYGPLLGDHGLYGASFEEAVRNYEVRGQNNFGTT